MALYLFDEQPIVANKVLAREIGLYEALVLQQINYWIEINKKTGKNYYDGYYWTYNSLRAWHESDFDYLSPSSIKRTFANLENEGYLLVGNYNKDRRDKTKWYTINEEKLKQLYEDIERRKAEAAKKALEEAEREENERVVQDEQKEEIKNVQTEQKIGQKVVSNALVNFDQCNGAFSTNALVSSDPMQWYDLTQPLPEITTEITTENNIYPSIYPNNEFELERKDGMKERKIISMTETKYSVVLNQLRKQVGYDEHIELGNYDKAKRYDEILSILADVYLIPDDGLILINQNKIAVAEVKQRFSQLREEHMDFIIGQLQNYQHKIHNARAFVLTLAFNAVTMIESHYSAMVKNYYNSLE